MSTKRKLAPFHCALLLSVFGTDNSAIFGLLNKSKEGTFIYDEYIYHIIFQYEISAIKIKSKDHADAMRIMFNEMWNKAKK